MGHNRTRPEKKTYVSWYDWEEGLVRNAIEASPNPSFLSTPTLDYLYRRMNGRHTISGISGRASAIRHNKTRRIYHDPTFDYEKNGGLVPLANPIIGNLLDGIQNTKLEPLSMNDEVPLETIFDGLTATIAVLKTRFKALFILVANAERRHSDDTEKARKYDEIMATINK